MNTTAIKDEVLINTSDEEDNPDDPAAVPESAAAGDKESAATTPSDTGNETAGFEDVSFYSTFNAPAAASNDAAVGDDADIESLYAPELSNGPAPPEKPKEPVFPSPIRPPVSKDHRSSTSTSSSTSKSIPAASGLRNASLQTVTIAVREKLFKYDPMTMEEFALFAESDESKEFLSALREVDPEERPTMGSILRSLLQNPACFHEAHENRISAFPAAVREFFQASYQLVIVLRQSRERDPTKAAKRAANMPQYLDNIARTHQETRAKVRKTSDNGGEK